MTSLIDAANVCVDRPAMTIKRAEDNREVIFLVFSILGLIGFKNVM